MGDTSNNRANFAGVDWFDQHKRAFRYLGQEIIALMQTARSFAPNDSRSDSHPAFRKNDDRIIPLMVLSRTLTYSDSSTASVLDVWVDWRS